MSRLPHVVQPEDIGYWSDFDAITFEVWVPRGPGKELVTVAIPRAMLMDLGLRVDCKGGPPAVPAAIERWRDKLGAHVGKATGKRK